MQKKQFVEKLSERLDLPKVTAEKTLNSIFQLMVELLSQGEEVSLSNFGKFSKKVRAKRQGRNPATGKAITIAAKTVVVFKHGLRLKEAMNKG